MSYTQYDNTWNERVVQWLMEPRHEKDLPFAVDTGDPERGRPTCLIGRLNLECVLNKAAATPPGDFVEVGCYEGGTSWFLALLAKEQGRQLYLFDTFEGMPHSDPANGDEIPVGSVVASEEKVRRLFKGMDWVHITKGVFPHSAPFLRLTEIAFSHIDCDQYEGVRDSALALKEVTVPGGILWFDDPVVLRGAFKGMTDALNPQEIIRDTHPVTNYSRHYWIKP